MNTLPRSGEAGVGHAIHGNLLELRGATPAHVRHRHTGLGRLQAHVGLLRKDYGHTSLSLSDDLCDDGGEEV